MKRICIISQRYPCQATPVSHVFVQKLAWAMAEQGVHVDVISPVPVYDKRFRIIPEHYTEKTPEGKLIDIYRPQFVYAGERIFMGIKLSHISADTMYRTAIKVIEKYKIFPDAFYGHFICVAGICACRLGEKYKKPSYIAYGESTDWSIENYGLAKIKKEVNHISGFVAVSTNNRNKLIEFGLANTANVKVFVNGYNAKLFYPRDRLEARKKYGIKDDEFVVSFVGQFSERKGVFRLNQAISQMDEKIKVIYAGKGNEKPQGKHVLYADTVLPQQMPEFLSASDVFVLPTKNEGCSNAILEAIACGLPVISSDCPFNYDILDDSNAVLIDPDSIEEIKMAIEYVRRDSDLREKMSASSIKKREFLSIDKRAKNILTWIEERNKVFYEK